MAKYKLAVPDANKPSIKISGIKLNNVPFKIIGSILLKAEREGFRSFQVIETSFDDFFPVNETFWSMTDMFCNLCNSNIHSYRWNGFKSEYEKLLFNNTWMLWSKHKVDEYHWKVLLYDKNDIILSQEVEKYLNSFESGIEFYEFKIE